MLLLLGRNHFDENLFTGADSDSEDSHFQNLLNTLFQNFQPRGPPPASKNVVLNLTVISREDLPNVLQDLKCTICFEDFIAAGEGEDAVEHPKEEEEEETEEQMVLQLPCK